MPSIKPEAIMRHVDAVFPGLAMMAGIKLDIFTRLYEKSMNAEELAKTLNVAENKLSPLLYVLTVTGLLKLEKGVFSNTPESKEYLVQGETCIKEYISFLIDNIWSAVSKTAETIKNHEPQSKIDWSNCTNHDRSLLLHGQYPGGLLDGRELGEKVDFSSSMHILDSAGGSGGLAVGLCESYRDLRMTIAELPEVVPFTKRFISEAGMNERISVVGVDIIQDPPNGVYDVAVVRFFIQVLSAEDAQKALKNIHTAITPGGSIYIIGRFLDDTHLFPQVSVVHNLLFLNRFESGQAYTEKECRMWLESAGFENIEIEFTAFSDGAGLITARKG
ncbi:MAG: methyltransferase [Thermodesulfobacteriota bacterium]|nr:methyltransferase [Thermodesulfobacteriota bacterium]